MSVSIDPLIILQQIDVREYVMHWNVAN